jgi:hypothetical protein
MNGYSMHMSQYNRIFIDLTCSAPSLTKRSTAGEGVPAANESDGGRVKRPMNAFMVWARHSRPYLAQQMPQLSNSEISIKLGELWRMLPEDIKSVYYDEAHRIKEQHERDNPGMQGDWGQGHSLKEKDNKAQFSMSQGISW